MRFAAALAILCVAGCKQSASVVGGMDLAVDGSAVTVWAITIDATELTQAKLGVAGSEFDTSVIQQLQLAPGSYSLEIAPGSFSDLAFEVTPAGAIDYPSTQIFSGRGSHELVIHGGMVTITAAPIIVTATLTNLLGGPIELLTTRTNQLRLLPSPSLMQLVLDAAPPFSDEVSVYVGLDAFSDFTYAPDYDDDLAGRGTPALYLRRR